MYVIWLDDARARAQLQLAHAAWVAAAAAAGARASEIDDWEDPADAFDGTGEDPAGRAVGPAARAQQIRAFLAASGQDGQAIAASGGEG